MRNFPLMDASKNIIICVRENLSPNILVGAHPIRTTYRSYTRMCMRKHMRDSLRKGGDCAELLGTQSHRAF